MSVNLIICTYGAKYGIMDKKNYLKESLSVLNNIKTSVDRITIMKPKIEKNHTPYENYYNFDNIDISNIKNIIKIVECENIGISYGQFLTGILNDLSFDYYIFTEDDYILFYDDFDVYLKNKVNSLNSYLCVFYYKNKKFILNNCLGNFRNDFINLNSYNDEIINKMNDAFIVPDHSCGIISNKTFKKVLCTFGSLDNLIKLFNFKCDSIWIYQVIFGYIFYLSNINIEDLTSHNLPLFYSTGECVNMCYEDRIISIKKLNKNINYCLDNPVFIPREIFYPYYQDYNINNLKQYINNFDNFLNQYNKINLHIKSFGSDASIIYSNNTDINIKRTKVVSRYCRLMFI